MIAADFDFGLGALRVAGIFDGHDPVAIAMGNRFIDFSGVLRVMNLGNVIRFCRFIVHLRISVDLQRFMIDKVCGDITPGVAAPFWQVKAAIAFQAFYNIVVQFFIAILSKKNKLKPRKRCWINPVDLLSR